MAYRIDYAVSGATLRAVVTGRASLGYAASIAREISEQADRASARRLLIDVRRLLERVGTLGALVGAGALAECRVAVVDVRENDPYYALHEGAARHGGRALRYFCDTTEALSWLGRE